MELETRGAPDWRVMSMSSRHSYDIIGSEVILFTGAGASCPLGFEALEGLLKLVMDKIKECDRWRRISFALGLFEKADSLEPVVNLEEFLERLDALVTLSNFEKEYETPWFPAQSGPEEKNSKQGAFFTSQFKSDLEAALELRREILITIRDHFTKSNDLMEKVVDLYQPLFKLLRKESGHTAIPVFTTNYDLALEVFTDRARSYGYGMIDGFDHRVHSTNPPWDPNEYHRFVLSAPGAKLTTLVLFKLHGSVFWQKSGERIVFNRQPSPEEIEYVLLYPTQTKTIVEDPFLTCYNYFEECLRNAKLMIAIGYSFGDDYLNQVIARCQLATPELEIMVFNPGFKDNPKRQEKFKRQIDVPERNRVYYDYFETGEQGEELLKEVERAVVGQHRWEKLSLEPSANDPRPLEKKYPELPLGEGQFNGVPFVLSTGYFSMHRMPAHVNTPAELRLDEPLQRVSSVHVLIIGGNVYKQHEGTALEGVTIGRIQLNFHDKSSQEKKLIVGANIREWVPGNRPGELVDSVTEQLCQVAWRGKDSSGKEIFIDHLEIPVCEQHRRKALEKILIFRDVQPGTPQGILSFSIFAITLECW